MARGEDEVMIGLAVRFDLGRYHANTWGAHVNEGAVEWPPSPWRILRALFATSRTNLDLAPKRAALDNALAQLAGTLPVYELPITAAAHSRHYVPSRRWSPSKPGDTDRLIDAFQVLDPEADLKVWWDLELPTDLRSALHAVCSRLGYLGRSESICSASITDDAMPSRLDALPLDRALELDGDYEVLPLLAVHSTEPLRVLEISVTELRHRLLLVPPGAQFVDYAVRTPATAEASTRPATTGRQTQGAGPPTLARFRVTGGGRPAIREAVALASHVRSALQSIYGRLNDGATSAVFSGRAGDRKREDQHRHAHYLPTPGRDQRQIDHVTVWAPEGFGEPEVASLAALREIRMRDLPEPLRLALVALGRAEQLKIPDLLGPSRRWRSLTPFGLPRHPKRRCGRIIDDPETQLRRELKLRGFVEPRSVRSVHGAWIDYRRARPGIPRLQARQAVGLEIDFDQSLLGPVALGALSHFGLGLFAPTEK